MNCVTPSDFWILVKKEDSQVKNETLQQLLATVNYYLHLLNHIIFRLPVGLLHVYQTYVSSV